MLGMEIDSPFLGQDRWPSSSLMPKPTRGKISMASAGNGTTGHVFGELFKFMTGVNMVHVPYRGGAPALTDLLGGQVQVYFGPIPESIEHTRAGKLRALAVTTSTRWEGLPDITTVGEFVPGYDGSGWYGIGAPDSGHATDYNDRV
jgi:tripartite-type tricarboxylate transporter receptor subunit TctC